MKLKPCPFCGSKNVHFNTDSLAIECQDCGCDGPFAGLEKGSNVRRRATERWNDRRRVTFQAMPGVCVFCGCTDDHACEGGCLWVNVQHTLCSACVPSSNLETLVQVCKAIQRAHESLFSQCCSNPIFNTWGTQVDVTELNNANVVAQRALRLIEPRPMTKKESEGGK